jgi:hypothetical protein
MFPVFSLKNLGLSFFLCYSCGSYTYNQYSNQHVHLTKYIQKYKPPIKTPTCFGTEVQSSGSYSEQRSIRPARVPSEVCWPYTPLFRITLRIASRCQNV